jgi:Family of unknown function (DUF6084)
MSELEFSVVDITPERYAASPTLTARLRIEEKTEATVHAIALRCQVRIDPQRRSYDQQEAALLGDLFGERHRWPTTLKPFLWMHANAMVQGFRGAVEVDLPLACTYDFEVAATKYLHAVREGDIPLSLLMSGMVFTRGATNFQVEQIPWHSDVAHRMPARVWREAMDAFFPGSGWIRIPCATLDALQRWKSERGLPTWEQAFSALLCAADQPAADQPTSPTPL